MARRQPIVSGLDPDIKNLLSLHRLVVEASLARQRATLQWTSAARHSAAANRERDARRAFNHALRDMQNARKAEEV